MNVAVFVAYVVIALVSHAVAGPLYGCSVVWLPAGMSLALFLGLGCRCWSGVLLGSVASYLAILRYHGVQVEEAGYLVAAGSGGLAALIGPGLGAYFIRRHGDWLPGLLSERGGLRFYALGGVIGGVVGGLVILIGWVLAGVIPRDAVWFFLLQQSFSMVLGTVAIAPLLILSSDSPLQFHGRTVTPRLTPLLVALFAVLGLMAYVSRSEVREREAEFQEMATKEVTELSRLIAGNLETLESIRSLWDSSNEVEEEEFGIFVSRPLDQNHGMKWLGWLPEIESGDREKWNEWARPRGVPGLAGLEGTDNGNANSVARQEGSAFPVLYAEPRRAEQRVLGFDLSMVEGAREIIETARQTDRPQASPLFLFDEVPSIAILQWVIGTQAGGDRENETESEAWLTSRPGVALAILNVQALFEKSAEEVGSFPIGIRLVDPDRTMDPNSLWKREASHGWDDREEGLFPREESDTKMRFGGKSWVLQARATRPLTIESPPWEIVGAQLIASLLVVLLGTLMMAAAGRTSRIEHEVETRTAELTEAKERFSQLADNITEGFWITEADGEGVIFLSRGVARIWGYSLEDLLADPAKWRESILAEDREKVRRAFRNADSEKGFDIEYRIRRADESIRWIRDRGFPVKDPSGDVIRMAGVADDTTELKRNEEKVLQAMREAREASELLEQFFKVSIDLLCVAGTDGYFKRINPAFHETLGFPDEELLSCPFIEFVHPDDVEQTIEAVKQLSEGELLIRFQNRYREKGGGYLWLEWCAVPDVGGKLIYAAARNVTEQKKMQLDLQRSNAELEQFAYLASHDLQEPLRVVTSFVQLLQKRYQGKMGEDADEYIRHAVDGAERMRKLILGLLELSRVERRGNPMERVDSREALDEALENLGVAIEESDAEIVIGDLPEINADGEQMVRLFQNLIGNAIKFCQGSRPRVEITARNENGDIIFSVEDNGPGIAEEQRERVFQIFQRLEAGLQVPGTGIGLSVCRRIVERHGGTIWVDESPSGGAAFRFRFPSGRSSPVTLGPEVILAQSP